MSEPTSTRGAMTQFLVTRWLPLALGLQLCAFFVVLALDPSGLDRCEADAGQGTIVLQISIACVALVTTVSMAIRRLKGQPLAVALLLTGCAIGGWFLVLDGGSQIC